MRTVIMWRILAQTLCVAILCLLSGCGESHSEGDGHDHDESAHGDIEGGGHGHGDGHEEEGGAEYDEKSGLLVHEEAANQIGLQITEVSEQKLTLQFSGTAQVFKNTHAGKNGSSTVLASAILPESNSRHLKVGDTMDVRSAILPKSSMKGKLVRLDKQTARAIGQVEAIFEVPDAEDQLYFGTFLEVVFHGVEKKVLAMPQSSVLNAATGTFAYVKNGERLQRTPIKTGASGGGYVEIVDGLVPGDEVVSRGVVDLWLIELRFTKGGGHSH